MNICVVHSGLERIGLDIVEVCHGVATVAKKLQGSLRVAKVLQGLSRVGDGQGLTRVAKELKGLPRVAKELQRLSKSHMANKMFGQINGHENCRVRPALLDPVVEHMNQRSGHAGQSEH